MVEIGHTFRAGWGACEKAFQNDGIPYSVGEFALQAAWDEYCGLQSKSRRAALRRAINYYRDAALNAAFAGAAHPDDRDDIAQAYAVAETRLKAAIEKYVP